MLCEFFVNGDLKKFRVSLVSNFKNEKMRMDYKLSCVNEETCSEYDGLIIPHEKFKNSWRENKIKVII
jgi:hypothetical protein